MKKMLKAFFVRFLVVLIAVQGVVATQLLTLQPVQASDGDSTPQVVINEVMWMGTPDSSGDEWLELRNTTGSEVSISGWTLTHALTGDADLVLPDDAKIPANGYYLVANYSAVDVNSALNIEANYVDEHMVLYNSCVQIDLLDSASNVIDSMGCDAADYYFPGSSSTHRALERNVIVTSGTDKLSWHESYGFANLDDVAYGYVLATPGSANTAALVSAECNVVAVMDVTDALVDWTGCFVSDTQSEIAGYEISADRGALADNWYDLGSLDEFAVVDGSLFNLGESTTFAVRAVDSNGNLSAPATSNSVVRNTPLAPVLGDVVNQPDSVNSGKVKATLNWAEVDTDPTLSYEISYKPVDSALTEMVTTSAKTLEISNLESNLQYQYSVVAVYVDGSSNEYRSIQSNVVLDKVPTLDRAKIALLQNKPGTDDSLSGLAGAVNFGSAVEINVLTGDPKELLDSQTSNVDGSFAHSVVLGDNKYGKVWIQLIDEISGKSSQAYEFTNDIVAPNAPTLTKLVSKCETDTCRVELSWTDNGPDTVKYQVGYTVDGVETRTVDLTSTSVQTDLAAGKSYKYVVYAYDVAGNVSVASNFFEDTLIKGIQTEINLVNDLPVVTKTALEGSNVTSVTSVSTSKPLSFVAPVQASDNQPSTEGTDTETKTEAAKQDWVRIFVVVVLLLIVAGGFYALSRTFKEEGNGLDNASPKKAPARVVAKTKKNVSKSKTKKANRKKK